MEEWNVECNKRVSWVKDVEMNDEFHGNDNNEHVNQCINELQSNNNGCDGKNDDMPEIEWDDIQDEICYWENSIFFFDNY